MQTLYLHLGAHRTGTSSIQNFLHLNAGALAARGVLYPFGVKRHLDLANRLFAGQTTADEIAEGIRDEIAACGHDIHSVILSDEDIAMRRDLSALAGLARHFRVRPVYSLRRQDLWLESWYLQNLKWQWNPELSHCTLDGFMARRADFHWIDYDRSIRHLEDLFGAENVVIEVFEKGRMPGGPVESFCRAVGIDDPSTLKPAPHANPSRTPLVSEFMRCLPLDEAPPAYRARLERACGRVDAAIRKAAEGPVPMLLLDHPARQAVMAEYEPSNRALARRRFGRDELFAEPLPGPDAALARMALPGDSYRLMEELVAPLLRELIVDFHRQTKKAGRGA